MKKIVTATVLAISLFVFNSSAYAGELEDFDLMALCKNLRTQITTPIWNTNIDLAYDLEKNTDKEFWLTMAFAFQETNEENKMIGAAKCYATYDKYD